jgi:hypothetical protein
MALVDDIKKRFTDLAAHEGVRRYFFNTGWMFAEKALRLIAGLFIGAYVARYLGPSKFGLFNYALSIVSVFSVMGSVGLDSIVVRELVRTPNNRDTNLGTAFVLKFLGGVDLHRVARRDYFHHRRRCLHPANYFHRRYLDIIRRIDRYRLILSIQGAVAVYGD